MNNRITTLIQALRKVELTLVVGLILVLALVFSPQSEITSITGFVSSEVNKQRLDLHVQQSQVFTLQSDEPFVLTQFSISGKVAGNGTAYVYLETAGTRALIYSNVQKMNAEFLSHITGLAISDLSGYISPGRKKNLTIEQGPTLSQFIPLGEDETLEFKPFTDVCKQSCILPQHLFNSNTYNLIVLLEPGTTLHITGITYTSLES